MNKLLLVAALSSLLSLNASDGASGSTVIAEIDGAKLTLADLERKNPARLFQARNAFHEAERKAVDEFVEEYLLERQAKKENVTVAQLLERHVNSTIAKDPSDDALCVYYEGIDTAESFEAVRGKIAFAQAPNCHSPRSAARSGLRDRCAGARQRGCACDHSRICRLRMPVLL